MKCPVISNIIVSYMIGLSCCLCNNLHLPLCPLLLGSCAANYTWCSGQLISDLTLRTVLNRKFSPLSVLLESSLHDISTNQNPNIFQTRPMELRITWSFPSTKKGLTRGPTDHQLVDHNCHLEYELHSKHTTCEQ